MSGKFVEYNDAHSRAVFMAFKEAIGPLVARVAPDWLVHHMEIMRDDKRIDGDERVELRIVMKPIGLARVMDPNGDLRTGFKRLPTSKGGSE